ncbi:MAG: uroporphyrinogen-III synthase [Acidobacteriota bacterium]|nr:uroporphyrinogen-III synthase [Acidobacteriota bacterium]
MSEILVIREKDVFTSILIEQGFSVTNFPVIKTEPLANLSELENFLAEIETFDGIFITSSKAAEIVSAKLKETEKHFNGKFYVLGKRSNDLLKKSDYETFFSEYATTAEELLKSIPEKELQSKKFLFPRGNRSLRVIPEKLENIAEVFETIVYQTTEIEIAEKKIIGIKEKFESGKIDAICFFSPSGVENFLKTFESISQGEIKIAVIGQTTAQCVEENNLRVDFISAKPIAKDFATGLTSYLSRSYAVETEITER